MLPNDRLTGVMLQAENGLTTSSTVGWKDWEGIIQTFSQMLLRRRAETVNWPCLHQAGCCKGALPWESQSYRALPLALTAFEGPEWNWRFRHEWEAVALDGLHCCGVAPFVTWQGIRSFKCMFSFSFLGGAKCHLPFQRSLRWPILLKYQCMHAVPHYCYNNINWPVLQVSKYCLLNSTLNDKHSRCCLIISMSTWNLNNCCSLFIGCSTIWVLPFPIQKWFLNVLTLKILFTNVGLFCGIFGKEHCACIPSYIFPMLKQNGKLFTVLPALLPLQGCWPTVSKLVFSLLWKFL